MKGITTTQEKRDQAKVLHSRGMSCRQIGRELNISRQTAHNIVSNGAVRKTPKTKASPQETRFSPDAIINAARATVTIQRFVPHPNGRVCNSSMTDIYKGEELARMGR